MTSKAAIYQKEYYKKNKTILKQKRIDQRSNPIIAQQYRDRAIAYKYKSWRTYAVCLVARVNDEVTPDEVMELLERQKYKCALSGIHMTHSRGSIFNMSLDRIEAGGAYDISNLQLVCKILNIWRRDADVADFVKVAKAVTYFNGGLDNEFKEWYNELMNSHNRDEERELDF